MIAVWNHLGNTWALYFGITIVENTIFLTLVFFALFMLKNASAKIKCSVALLGIAKLFVPPFIPGPFLFSAASVQIGPITVQSLLSAAQLQSDNPAVSTNAILFLIWASTLIIYISIAIFSTLLVRKKLHSNICNLTAEKLSQKIELVETDKISSPMSFGLYSRKIYVPSYWQSLPPDCQRVMLQHELAHLQRHDGIVQFLQILAQAVYFFHPMVWLLNERIHEYREMACDDIAIENSQLSPLAYSRYLVHIAERMTNPQWSHLSISALIKQKNKLLNRVDYQIKENKMKKISKRKVQGIIAGLILLILPLSLYSSSQKTPEDQKAGSTTAAGPNEVIVYTKAPEIIKKVMPEYPQQLKDAGIEGTVYLKLWVDKQGNVQKTEVIKSEQAKLDQLAKDAAKQWIFTPALQKDGKPVDAAISIPFKFNLKEKPKEGATSDFVNDAKGPLVIKRVMPEYPQQLRDAGIEDTVWLKILVDENGKVQQTVVVKGEQEVLMKLAIDAANQWIFTPAEKDGKPISAWVSIPFKFTLKDEQEENTSSEYRPYDKAPEIVKKAMPKYPQQLRDAGIEGTVWLKIWVDQEDGKIKQVEVVKSEQEALNQLAIDAAKQMVFTPAQKGGKPVSAWVTIPFKFTL
jgi:TonB family protein